jgi:hypothetical protein
MATTPFVIVPSLTAIAVAYTQKNLIADRVLPRVPVSTKSFRYLKYGLGDAFTVPETAVGRKGTPNQVEFASSEATDTTQDHALDSPVPNDDMRQWQSAKDAGQGYVSQADPQSRAAAQVTSLVLTRREKRAADLVFNPASYGTNNKATLSGTSQWSDYTNSKPQQAINAALDGMVMRPNVAVFGRLAWSSLSTHPQMAMAIFKNGTNAGKITTQQFADLFELDEVIVGDAWINTAAKGQAPNVVRLWGKHCALLHRNAQADTDFGVTFGMTAQFGERVAGVIEDPDIGMNGGVRVRAGESVKELVTANDLGYLFTNAVA